MIIRHIQTILHKLRNTVSLLLSSTSHSNEGDYKPGPQFRGLLWLRILIHPETFYDTDPVLLYCYITGWKERLPKVKIEVEPADIPSDKLCFVTVILEGRLEWQGYLSRWPEKYCIGSAQQAVSFPIALQDDWLDFCNALQRDIVVIPCYRPLFP